MPLTLGGIGARGDISSVTGLPYSSKRPMSVTTAPPDWNLAGRPLGLNERRAQDGERQGPERGQRHRQSLHLQAGCVIPFRNEAARVHVAQFASGVRSADSAGGDPN